MKKGIIVLFLLCIFLRPASAALGIGPATQDLNYVPGQTYTYTYHIISDNPDEDITLYAEGDLAQYVVLSKTSIKGPESFTATVSFPSTGVAPGKHQLLIGAREKPSEDSFISATINIRAVIYVYVPYPGRYAEIELNIPNVNAGDLIPVEAHVINRGKEKVTANVAIDFYTDGNKIETMNFEPVELETAEDRYFRKYLNSTGYKPGTYFASARVNYGDVVETNATFHVGSLFVNVTNFTTRVHSGAIQKFYVNIESQWNNKISSVYADVNVTNGVQNITFKTPSISLEPWNRDTLTGYLDTTDLKGKYSVIVSLRYGDGETISSGMLEVIEENSTLVYVVAGIVIVLIALFVIGWFVLRRRRK